MKKNVFAGAITFALATLLPGCGSGGGGSSSDLPPLPPQVFPVEPATFLYYFIQSSYTVSGSDGTNNYTLVYSITPEADVTDSTYSTSSFHSAKVTASTSINGGASTDAVSHVYFSRENTSPFTSHGGAEEVKINGTNYTNTYVLASSTALPSSGKIGDTGSVSAGTYTYHNQDGSTTSVPQTVAWALEADPTSTVNAWLCYTTSSTRAAGAYTEKDCINIDEAGAVHGFKQTKTTGGVTLTLK